jgi:hypothetical protein
MCKSPTQKTKQTNKPTAADFFIVFADHFEFLPGSEGWGEREEQGGREGMGGRGEK